MERRCGRWAVAMLCVMSVTSVGEAGGQAPGPRADAELTVLTASAEAGDPDAQSNLGWKHYEGNGAPKDYGQAARWLRRAAEQGHLAAQVRLGNLYEWGHGVAEDPRIAATWYQKAADGGLAHAHFALGKLYLDGNGVSKDATQALAAFRRAADGGFPMAAFVLGELHRSGEGVRQDNVEAYVWLLVATASPEIPPFVAGVRDDVAATLTANEREQAERLAAQRRPRSGAQSTVASRRGPASPNLSGRWVMNTDLSSPTTGPGSDGLDGGRGGGRGGSGGGRGGGFGGGRGRGGFGGGFGGGRGGGGRPSEEEMQRQRTLMREALMLPARFTLIQTDTSITLTEPSGVSRTYQAGGQREKHQLTSGVVDTKTEWANGALVMELKTGRRTITRRFTLQTASDRRRLEVSTSVEGAPQGAHRLVVYDEEPAIP